MIHFLNKILIYIELIIYYGFLRFLPQYLPDGTECNRIRCCICKNLFEKCGKNVNIKKGACFGSGKNIRIGNNSDIGLNARIYGLDGGGRLIIGNNVMMGPDVTILTIGHYYSNRNEIIKEQGIFASQVTIEDDAWICAKSIIMPGVVIGKGSVVGAGSVVTKDVPPYVVVGGNPARIIKRRGQ